MGFDEKTQRGEIHNYKNDYKFTYELKQKANGEWQVGGKIRSDNEDGLYAWEILWSGTNADKNNRYFPYTETGLLNMIRVGTFEYVACIKK